MRRLLIAGNALNALGVTLFIAHNNAALAALTAAGLCCGVYELGKVR